MRRVRLGWPLVAMLIVSACGSGERSEQRAPAEPAPPVVAEPEPAADTAPQLRRFLPDDMRRSTRAESFAHEAHVRIACQVCHGLPEGHGSHGDVTCASCHRASAQATLVALSPEQCQSCHHGPEQALGCEHCHQTRGALESVQRLAFAVGAAPHVRALAFDHAAHADLDCSSCHRSAPALTPAESCASCHNDHMEAQVRCAACHTAPLEAHDVNAHVTCSGTGCHSSPIVEALANTRPVCLLCHQAQEDHEPGGDCIECHRVRPGSVGGAGR